MAVHRKSAPGRGNSLCKGPEVGACLAFPAEAGVAGNEQHMSMRELMGQGRGAVLSSTTDPYP